MQMSDDRMADSPSSHYSIDGLAELVASLPESDNEANQSEQVDGDPFDIDILIRKLEAYKASVEDIQAQIRRKRSINPKEVSEVTAAARLKLRLDGRPAASSESHEYSVLPSPIALAFPSSVSSNGSSASETSYFDPITPEEHDDIPISMVSSRTKNRDTWKSSHSVVLPSEGVMTYDISTRLGDRQQRPGRLGQEVKIPKPLPSIKLLGSRSKVTSPLASPAFSASDWLGLPRTMGSLTMAESDEVPRKKIDKMSLCPPNEDHFRREIETYTIKDWVETEDVKQLEVIASSKEPGQVHSEHSHKSDDDFLNQSSTVEETIQPLERYEYGRSTFRERVGSLWHRRTKTDKIIALYFDMETSPKQKVPRT